MSKKDYILDYPLFTKEMKKTYNVLVPSFLDSHMDLLAGCLERKGYRCIVLENKETILVREGLKYVHNDTCYPATCVIGQFLDALTKLPKEELDHTALILTQTGGGCRASNYVPLLRRALENAGFGQIPVITLNLGDLANCQGMDIDLFFLLDMIAAVSYGDCIMYLHNKTRSYEVNKGESDALVVKWNKIIREKFIKGKASSFSQIKKNLRLICEDFNKIELNVTDKPKVGIVGEIYVKYSSIGNNDLENFLIKEGAEILVPGVMGFLMYCFANGEYDHRYYNTKFSKKIYNSLILWFLTVYEKRMRNCIKKYTKFDPPEPFKSTRKESLGIIKHGAKMGEGWLLTAEMNELIKIGYSNIVCAQPFGCLPNHVCGKGVMNRLKELHPEANITPIDYDSSASKVNQENRIKLMLALAREKIEKERK